MAVATHFVRRDSIESQARELALSHRVIRPLRGMVRFDRAVNRSWHSWSLSKGRRRARRFDLDGERAVIGRSAECEVPLDVPAVSRRHAAILRDRGRFFIEDLQSRNGTFLNDQRVSSARRCATATSW